MSFMRHHATSNMSRQSDANQITPTILHRLSSLFLKLEDIKIIKFILSVFPLEFPA